MRGSHLDLRHARAQAREGLRQLAADRAAAQHHQPLGALAQLPDVVGGQHLDLVEAGDRRHEGPRAGGDDDGARGQALHPAVVVRDLHFPGRDDARRALRHVDTQPGVALHRIVRLDLLDDPLHALHHFAEVEVGCGTAHAELLGALHMRQELGRADQRLGRHAAGVQAVAAHRVLLHQRDLGLDGRGDVGRDQPGRAAADDDQVAVEARRLLEAGVDLAGLEHVDDLLGDEREDPQQHQRAQHAGRDDARQRLDARQLRAGVHVDQRAGQHAELADPVEGPGAQRGHAHRQVDDEERQHRHQAQREQVEAAFLGDAGVRARPGGRRSATAPSRPAASARPGRPAWRRWTTRRRRSACPSPGRRWRPAARVITAAPGSDSAVTAT